MSHDNSSSFTALKQQFLCVIFFCFIPHFTTAPWWISIIFLAVMLYLFISNGFHYPLLPGWLRFIITIGCWCLLYSRIHFNDFFVDFFLIAITLKCLEAHTIREFKVLALCNFYLIFSALFVVQELWMIIYLFIAIFANLSIMLKLHAPKASLKQIGGRSGQQLLIAIPLSIILFYIFPRLDPLWHVGLLTAGRTGFNDIMSPQSIAKLFNDDSIAMQITFKDKPIFNGYWKGVILSYYTGEKWISSLHNYAGSFFSLRELNENEKADYEVILEPNQKQWLFYEGYPLAGSSNFLFSPNHGLIRQNKEIISRLFFYALKIKSPPYHDLNSAEYAEATQLPHNINPRLSSWAKKQFANQNNNATAFIAFLHNYIHQQPYWYTLEPPIVNSDKNEMDSFWFDTQKGYCEYYASAVTYILRAVGIPAHVVIGYYGGQWNSITRAITLEQNDAHAWLEYWVAGIGWQQLDPTSFIALDRIDQRIRNRQYLLYQKNDLSFELSWANEIKLYVDSARFFAERWFLFYNKDTQQNLLQRLGLGGWKIEKLFQASVVSIILFFIILTISYNWWQKRALDKLLLEYHLLQKEFNKFNIIVRSSTTLKLLCDSLVVKAPHLAPMISSFLDRYEQLRLKQAQNDTKENINETIALFKKLRYALHVVYHRGDRI